MKIEKINKERKKGTQKAFNKERDNVYAIGNLRLKKGVILIELH